MLGVNFGHLGFLAEVEGRELDEALSAMAEERVTIEVRGCLVVRHGELGEAGVQRRRPGAGAGGGAWCEATLSVGGRRYGHFRCDAVILATPMGSTAYSYAAGGPVVSPGVEGILVTPSAPMTGITRSVLLAPSGAAAAAS